MKKIYSLLVVGMFFTYTFAQVTGQLVSEKTYPDNTRICYFEIDKALSEQVKDFLQQKIETNDKIMRLLFFDSNDTILMFESIADFTLDSMINFINNNINQLSESGVEIFSRLQAPQRALPTQICGNIKPACADNGLGFVFPAVTGQPNSTSVGCLGTIPNPSYYWFKIEQPGNINIYMSGPLDLDFICWGPFNNIQEACEQVSLVSCAPVTCPNNTTSPNFYPYGNIVDCSYDAAHYETVHITNAQSGQYYLLLITNYTGSPGNIDFHQVSGNATTDCSIVVPISSNSPLCVGDTLKLTAGTQSGATYKWTGPGGWTSNQQNPMIANVTTANAGTYSLVLITNGVAGHAQTLEVVVNTPSDTTFINATICRGGRYEFPDGTGIYRTEQGSYHLNLENINHCDSVVTLKLFIDSCYVTYDDLEAICADDQSFIVTYNNFGGTVNCVSAVFPPQTGLAFQDVVPCIPPTNNTFEIPIPPSTETPPSYVRPGHYYVDLIFDYTDNSQIIKKLDFTVLYPSWIIEQKWNDVLALLNQYYNGGYAFSSYEWYKDNVKINDANGSYIYLGEGNTFNFTSEYRVKLTRTDDKVTLFTCAYTPYDRSNLVVSPFPTVVDGNSTIHIKSKGNGAITFISVSGIVISKQKLSIGENPIQTPKQSGFYIMVIEEENQVPIKQILVVK